MGNQVKTNKQLLQEIESLRGRLEGAEAALDAIRNGGVDALVISSDKGEQVFILQGAEHPYRVMVETMNEGAATVLDDGSILYANPRLAAILGEPLETLIGSSILDFILPADAKLFEAAVDQGYRSSSRAEIHLQSKDKTSIPVLISFSPIKVEDGLALCLVVTDLTEQQRSDEIVAAERLTRSILDQVAEAILVCDTGGKIIRANQAALLTFPQNPLYQQFEKALPLVYKNLDGGGTSFAISKVLDGENFQEIEVEYPSSQGKNRFFLLNAAPLLKDQGNPVGCIITLFEVTERMRIEEALRESEHRFRVMADGTPVIIWVTDAAGKIEFVNRAYSDFFGVTPQEVQSGGWQPLVHPDDIAGYGDVFMDCIRERRTFRAQARVRLCNGQWRWIDSLGQPRFSDSGEFLGMAGSSLDITERKAAEEAIQSYAYQLKRSNKELQDFAFIASHDLQEPLRKIVSFSNLIGVRSNLKQSERDYLRRVQDAAQRMQKMIADLLELSRVTTHKKPFERVDMNSVAKTIVDDLESRIRQVQGRVVLNPLPVIEADEIQMHQLLQNLVGNALKFHRPDTPPVVQIGYQDHSPGIVEVFIQDNGIGFDIEYKDQIFQPFKRLHGRSEYEGSGIGLAICQKIAERHGGRITAQSAPGEGAIFSVLLPLKQIVR